MKHAFLVLAHVVLLLLRETHCFAINRPILNELSQKKITSGFYPAWSAGNMILKRRTFRLSGYGFEVLGIGGPEIFIIGVAFVLFYGNKFTGGKNVFAAKTAEELDYEQRLVDLAVKADEARKKRSMKRISKFIESNDEETLLKLEQFDKRDNLVIKP